MLNGSLNENSEEISLPPPKPTEDHLSIVDTLFQTPEEATPMPQKPYYKEVTLFTKKRSNLIDRQNGWHLGQNWDIASHI
jgi:hypothetical protein